VTGELGGAALGLALLEAGVETRGASAVGRWRRPSARVPEGLAIAALASAAIDLSDGLLQDVTHLAVASGVAVELELSRLPIHPELLALGPEFGLDPQRTALTGGEDYELAFSHAEGRAPGLGTLVGRVVQGTGVRVLDANRRNLPIRIAGFDHFE
jgi:thiamine-monophosphate kinase